MAWKTLFAAIVALAILPCAAPAQENFPDVQSGRWVDQIKTHWQLREMLTGETGGLYSGPPPNSRDLAHLFAEVIAKSHRDWDAVRGKTSTRPTTDQVQQAKKDVERFATFVPELARLRKELLAELVAVGLDVEAERQWLDGAEKRARAARLGILGYVRGGQETHFLYEAVLDLKKEGINVGWPFGFRNSHSEPLHIDIVEGLVKAMEQHHALWETGKRQSPQRADKLLLENAKALAKSYPNVILLLEYFSGDLAALGFDVDAEKRWLSQAPVRAKTLPLGLVQPFPDVPKDHWAAKAVENLRALGLLTGYPGGKFRG